MRRSTTAGKALAMLEAFKTEVFEDSRQVDHLAQRQPRYFFRPLDKSLSRLRAWLHLLLRAPKPLLSRAFRGSRFRDQALRQVQCRRSAGEGTREARLQAGDDRAWGKYRPLSADRARAPDHALDPRGDGARPIIRSESSRNRRWLHATSISCGRWRRKTSRRSRCRSPRSTAALPARWSREPRRRPKRLEAVRRLTEAGIPVTVMVAPIIPGLTDHEIEPILEAAREAGARDAGYVLLRLPLEIKDLFREWLREEFPDRAERVISLLQSMHGGQRLHAGVRHPPARHAGPMRRKSRCASGSRRSGSASAKSALALAQPISS